MIKSAEDYFIECYENSIQWKQDAKAFIESVGGFYSTEKEKKLAHVFSVLKGEGHYNCEYELGITKNDRSVLNTTSWVLEALGYDVHMSYSDNWCNELMSVKIDRKKLEDKVLYHSIMSIRNKRK